MTGWTKREFDAEVINAALEGGTTGAFAGDGAAVTERATQTLGERMLGECLSGGGGGGGGGAICIATSHNLMTVRGANELNGIREQEV